ncbi:alpha-N-acetylgalactosaminide alpha-2,6-sialyltransferase 2 [Pangasianodon hypophthalmus]|uniref:alpha-N-acetylgalactosaminide alpha-2,6-sialyltransferase 2 n=1 Tax=Pangasianodon hypophthalmus TaxID=310915 RepID=UPI0023079E86|nr:alpha-N-acetylgalactosaminide alpha-2,6-sialyltransferase 2 [Pangasianodon hypophthalmus]
MCFLYKKKLVFSFLFLFVVLGSYIMHSNVKILPWPKDQTITPNLPSSVAESARHTTRSPEDPPKTTKPTAKPTAKPTEPDSSGDKYASDDDIPQSSCTSSIRKTVLQTAFGERFLANVPVLQWAKHVSKQEYERLRRYYGAQGWGSVDFKVLQNSLAILNTSANRLMFDDWEKRQNRSQCIRCAVVGNGGILKGSKKGREIDENDYVFRTNGAVIKGFEEDIGSRTSFYTFSTNTLQNSLISYADLGFNAPPRSKETKYIFLPDHDRDYILMRAAVMHTPVKTGSDQGVEPAQYFGDDMAVEKFKMYHPDFIRYLTNRFLRSDTLDTIYKNIYRPSTGAVMLLAAFHTCDEVNAYGFMTPDYQNYSDHYYDKTVQPVLFYANHDLNMELNLWQQLHKAGLIKLYMRT